MGSRSHKIGIYAERARCRAAFVKSLQVFVETRIRASKKRGESLKHPSRERNRQDQHETRINMD